MLLFAKGDVEIEKVSDVAFKEVYDGGSMFVTVDEIESRRIAVDIFVFREYSEK